MTKIILTEEQSSLVKKHEFALSLHEGHYRCIGRTKDNLRFTSFDVTIDGVLKKSVEMTNSIVLRPEVYERFKDILK